MFFNYALANQFINVINPLPDDFGLIDYDIPNNYYEITDAVEAVDAEASVRFGMSKLVICSPKLGDAVLKVPFNGYYTEDGDWCSFCWASGSDNSDYCLTEYEKYQELKKRHLDCFVAKTFFYKTCCNKRFFIQEAVTAEADLDEISIKQPSEKSFRIANSWYKSGELSINPEWTASCIDYYGIAKVESFLDYCNNVDLDILEDCHHSNYGYRRKSNTPAILDYSNFTEG